MITQFGTLPPPAGRSARDRHVGGRPSVEIRERLCIDGVGEGDLSQLTVIDKDSWSAFTLRVQDRHLVVFNPAQSPPRINSVVMHELSHIMLGHELTSAGMTSDGHLIPSNYDQEQEAEAVGFVESIPTTKKELFKPTFVAESLT